jgi:ubiquinone/menaquinone biosynthesis C-methylase UbiE
MARFDFEDVFGEDYLHFYLPRLTAERNLAETEEIIDLLGLKRGDKVLDAPCGHGRISNLLSAEGVAVTGVDSSDLFLERARADAQTAGVEVAYHQGDLRDLPAADGEFDAVVNWFTSFGYFDDEDNQLVLREFHRVLQPGGKLLIEMMNRDGIVRTFPAVGSTNVERAEPSGEDLMIDTSTFDAISGRLHTERIVVRDGKTSTSNYSVRLPAPTEFRTWLEAAGFHSTRFQSRGGELLGSDSRRLVVLADA